jgi:Periplasmic binding protein-like domain
VDDLTYRVRSNMGTSVFRQMPRRSFLITRLVPVGGSHISRFVHRPIWGPTPSVSRRTAAEWRKPDASLRWSTHGAWSKTHMKRPGRFSKKAIRPTAIFAGHDQLAIGVLRAIAELGLGAEDVSVVGHDNINLAAHPRISLTTGRPVRSRDGSGLDRVIDGANWRRKKGSEAPSTCSAATRPQLKPTYPIGITTSRRNAVQGLIVVRR